MRCCKILLDRETRIKEHPCHYFLPFDVEKDVNIRILSCSMIDEISGYSIMGITDNCGVVKEGQYVKEDGKCDIVSVGSDSYMAIVTNMKCVLARLINESRCFLVSAVPQTDTLIEWTLVGPSDGALSDLRRRMKEEGYEFKTQAIYEIDSKISLTTKEVDAFNLAMNLGYYDVPKRTTLDSICALLGCSKSTLNVRLRNAEKKIFEHYRIFSMGSHMKRI